MKKIKAVLLRLLGPEIYLSLTSRFFFLFFEKGWLKNKAGYQTHYFVRNFIKPGQTVLDIGGNLGYYAVPFAKMVGSTGIVLSVEPIELYRRILIRNIKGFPQVKILPYALGEKAGLIKMGNPTNDKHRHGLMHVLRENETVNNNPVYEVEMRNPADLFAPLEKIDYIKCDIEGYEVPVIPAMGGLIAKHRPIMQVETEGPNLVTLHQFFTHLQYHLFYVKGARLVLFPNANGHLPADLIAIPSEKAGDYQHLISQ